MPRELIVRPLGLVTRPNQYGQYPLGGLSSAINCVMRAPGILSAAPDTEFITTLGLIDEVVHELIPVNAALISVGRTSGGVWAVKRNGTAYANPSNMVGAVTYSANGFTPSFTARGRVFINSVESGLLVIDDPNVAPVALRAAGLPMPQFRASTGLNDGGKAVPGNNVCGYSAVFRRRFADGYEIASEPSPIYQAYNSTTSSMNFQMQVETPAVSGLQAGDIVELYKTNVILSGASMSSTAASTTDPGTTLQLVDTHTITSGDLAANSFLMKDLSQPNILGTIDGKALYTNPGQEGALGANKRPPISKCCALFKNFAFYGNITELGQFQFNVPAGIATARSTDYPEFDNDAWRTNGVGMRRVLGTVTIGSGTMTGISASHILGLKIGQRLNGGVGGADFSFGTKITSVGATSITFSPVATASGTGADIEDQLEIDGFEFFMSFSPKNVLFSIAGANGFMSRWLNYQINTSETLLDGQNPTAGFPKVDFLISHAQANRVSANNSITVRATNGANYVPPLPEITAAVATYAATPRANLLAWSKDSQPEHVPVPNYTQVGNGTIIALEATRDALWIFCTDGLFRLSGDGGQWRLDTIDTTCVLAAPRASCVLREVIYAYTNAGFVRVTDAGVEPLSQRIVGDLLPGAEYAETASIIVEKNEIEDEVVIRLGSSEVYVYSVRENAYTTAVFANVTAMAYARYPAAGLPALVFGASPAGTNPRADSWNSTTLWKAMSARFQPMFAGDPFTAKQWIDGSFVFSAASGLPNITPAWNGNLGSQSQVSGSPKWVNEGRVLFGVPRAAAVSNTLCPGFNVGARANRTEFLALSMRYRQFGEQHLKR